MTRLRTVLVVSALAIVATVTAVLLAWRPWDPVPDEVRAALARIDELPGVLDADVDYEVTLRDGKDGNTARALVSARLDADLLPQTAAETARHAAAVLDGVEIPGVTSLDRSVWVNAGEPTSTHGMDVFPVMVAFDDPGDYAGDGQAAAPFGVEEAFSLWHAGAVAVRGDATVRDGEHLVELARFAAEQGIAVSLRTTDDSLAYDAMGTVPDVTAVQLIADVATLPGVRTVGYDAYAEPALRVGLDVAHDSAQADEVLARLEAEDFAERAGHPVAVTLTDPAFTQRSGWVSALAPAEPEPHTLPLPADVEPWPDDDAPACTGSDLELSYGGSDAATGARFASVRARNVGDGPCAVEGVPGVEFRNAEGESQQDVTLEPYGPGVIAARVVVPAGAEIFAPIEWRAMSTANDPDVTTSIVVTSVSGADPVPLDVLGHVSSASGLDVLDGAQVRVGPWVQAAEGWS